MLVIVIDRLRRSIALSSSMGAICLSTPLNSNQCVKNNDLCIEDCCGAGSSSEFAFTRVRSREKRYASYLPLGTADRRACTCRIIIDTCCVRGEIEEKWGGRWLSIVWREDAE